MTELPEEARFTVEEMRRLEHEWRDTCGCEPICRQCREIRDVNDAIIPVLRRAGPHYSIEGISHLYPDPENPGHLSGAGRLIEVSSEFVRYYLTWSAQPLDGIPGSLASVTIDPAGMMLLHVLADNDTFVWELHKVPWWKPHAPTFLGVWPD